MVNALCQIPLFDTLATIAEAGASAYVRHDHARQTLVKWLDIDQLSWPDKEIVNVEWAGSRDDRGDRGAITLKTPGNWPYTVIIETYQGDQCHSGWLSIKFKRCSTTSG